MKQKDGQPNQNAMGLGSKENKQKTLMTQQSDNLMRSSTHSLQKSLRSSSQHREGREFIIKGAQSSTNNSNTGSTTTMGFGP